MNINANEILLLAKKNIKFRGEATPAPQSVAVNEPATTNPQSGLNALETQGQNNITFQGVKVPAAIKGKALGSMMALSLFAGALSSCDKTIEVENPKEPVQVTVTVNVDLTAITEMFNAMQIIWKDQVEKQQMTTEQMFLLNTRFAEFLSLYKQDKISSEEFYNKMYEFMLTNDANQKAIISLLIQNGKTAEEALKFIKTIQEDVKAGNLTAAEAYEKIMDELGNINSTLTEIKTRLEDIRAKMTANHEEYSANKEKELELLAGLFKQNEIRKEDLDALRENVKAMDEKLGNIEINTKDMIAMIKDDTKFNELKNILKDLKPTEIDYKEFEEMFAIYSLSIEEVIAMSADQVEAKLKSFIDFYLATEAGQTEQLIDINEKLGVLNMFPGLEAEELKDALAGLKDAIDKNTNSITGELGDIQAQLDKIQATLDNMFKQLGELSKEISVYNKVFADNWNKAIAKLDDLNGGLKDIKATQVVTNTSLGNINADIKDLKEAKVLANGYLAALLEKTGEIKDLIANLEANGKGGMTIDEFKAYMQERDKEQYEQFVQFTVDMGFDKLPGDVSTIKDLLESMNNKIQNLKDYSGQLDTVIGKLDNIADLISNPDYTAKLAKIIDLLENLDFTLEHDCEHQDKNIETNEGIIGDIGKILG